MKDFIKLLEILNKSPYFSPSNLDSLLQQDLQNQSFCNIFGITVENGLEKIEQRLILWQKSHNSVFEYCQKLGFSGNDKMCLLWKLWLPLAIQLSEKQSSKTKPLIQGILGVQGTGKTTLSKILCLILKQLGYTTISISIDDFYKTYREREKLKEIDPRFLWRGPPGTHDVQLGIKILSQLKDPNYSLPISIPRFDKSLWNGEGDRVEPEITNKPDIVLFEGWFLGVKPIKESEFNQPPLPIKTEEDKQFARDINENLKTYLPLWEKLDSLMVLYPKDYTCSKQWRKEAEQKMILLSKIGMNNRQVDEFVNYFWKALHPQLFVTPLAQNPHIVDLVITIDHNHYPQHIDNYLKFQY
ncbi:glycerate kinase [Crocosphaera sp. Alani8]|uniref:glycerate kinase n=1 Tax=Crocosphaera sp. Alani8 TaxID=3038952 RepID=UPI00313BBD9D